MLQVQRVSTATQSNIAKKTSKKRPTQVTVNSGENLSVIARRYGLSYQQFMDWTGLTNTFLKAGQKITLPQEAIPAGKGLSYLASKCNMSLSEFCKLNGISDYKTYVPMKGETFYMYHKKSKKPSSAPTIAKPIASSKPSLPANPAKISTPTKVVTNPSTTIAMTGGNVNTNPNKRVNLTNGKKFTAGDLRKDVIRSAKQDVKNQFREYCRKNRISYNENLLDLSPIDKYPLPTVNSNGKIVATEQVLQPTGKPNGKVVVLNAGHGGYRRNNGVFDPGAMAFVKQGGKYVPQFEYQESLAYANESASALRKEGYKVILLSGAANTIQDAIPKYRMQYGSNNVMLLSLHFKGTGGEKYGTDILHDAPNDRKYDEKLKNNLVNNCQGTDSLRTSGKNGLAVLNSSRQMASALIEIDRIDSPKINSAAFRAAFTRNLSKTVNQSFA